MLALRDSLILYHGSYASAECLALEGGASPMGFDEEAVTDEQREACAVVVMRTMLEDWCDDTGAPFDDALGRLRLVAHLRAAVRLLLPPVGRRPRQPPLRVGAGEEQLADLLGLVRATLAEANGAPRRYLSLCPDLCKF